MIVESWRVCSTAGGNRWWWVRVHDTQDALLKAAHRHAPWHGRDYWGDKVIGCCQPVRPEIRDTDDPDNPKGPFIWPPNGLAGVIRLVADELYPETIYHELAHAACATYRMNYQTRLDLGTGYEDPRDEESFAYIFGQLAADMDSALRERAA